MVSWKKPQCLNAGQVCAVCVEGWGGWAASVLQVRSPQLPTCTWPGASGYGSLWSRRSRLPGDGRRRDVGLGAWLLPLATPPICAGPFSGAQAPCGPRVGVGPALRCPRLLLVGYSAGRTTCQAAGGPFPQPSVLPVALWSVLRSWLVCVSPGSTCSVAPCIPSQPPPLALAHGLP